MRVLVALILCIASCALNGCMGTAGTITIHPHSDVTRPKFCRHSVDKPIPIMWLSVSTYGADRWEPVWELAYTPESAPEPKPQNPTLSELVGPPKAADTPARPFSCITYGRSPPGYKEKAPAAPLIPDKGYSVWIRENPDGRGFFSELHFSIKSDSSGRPIKLEYHYPGGPDRRVHVVTKPNTTEVAK